MSFHCVKGMGLSIKHYTLFLSTVLYSILTEFDAAQHGAKEGHRLLKPDSKSILVVDDNSTNLKMIMEILKSDYVVYPTTSGVRALEFLQSSVPDLILLDVEMPDMNGYQVLERLKADARLAAVPVIILTALVDPTSEEQALSLGAVDFISKPVNAGILQHRVRTHIELESYRRDLERLVERKTAQLTKTQDAVLDILANVTAFRDNETGAHILRTTRYVELIVEKLRALNLPGYAIDDIYAKDIVHSAKLHDIGKVAIADSILLKPDRLSASEFERIKGHTTFGAMMIDNAIHDIGEESSFLQTAKEIVFTHHECWDGSGYPQGLKGDTIPLSGRIMAIADVYDALISNRPYKNAFTHDNALYIIQSESGSHFDKTIVDACADVFPQFVEVAAQFSDSTDNDVRAW